LRWSAFAVLASLLTVSAARADPVAPMPSGFKASPDEPGYHAPTPYPGIYAHGFTGIDGAWKLIENRKQSGCLFEGKNREELQTQLPQTPNTEIWFYESNWRAVQFTKTRRLDVMQNCVPAFVYDLTIARGYNDDGVISIVRTDGRTGKIKPVDQGYGGMEAIWSEKINKIKHWTDKTDLSTLIARTGPTGHRKLSKSIRLGQPVSCESYSFTGAWSITCFLSSKGNEHNLTIYKDHGTDEGEESHFEFDTLLPKAEIDPRIFEVERIWTEE
jgi:hypothetical protein